MRYFLALLLPAALTLGASAPVEAQITGTVFDAYTSARLGGVTVSDSGGGSTARTDANGQFSLACDGSTTLLFRKTGYQLSRRTVANCDAEIRVELVPGAQSLNAVNVVAATEQAAVEEPEAITTLSVHELHRGRGLFLQDAINLTPGVYMQRRTMSGGQIMTIRGYGNNTNFAGTGYKAYLNGIPLTDAEGQTLLDDVDFASLGRLDVIRGPATSLYGAGIGGVVNFYTALPTEPGATFTEALTSGSDGLLRSDTRFSHVGDNSTVMLSYGHQGYDSYRVHSASKKDYGTFLGNFNPSSRQAISTYFSYAHSRDLRAGELDSAEFFQELNTGEPPYISNNARQDIESFRAGVTHRYRLGEHVENVATAYYTGNDLADVYAVGLNAKSIQNFGARVLFKTDFDDLEVPLHGVTGGDFQKTNSLINGFRMFGGVLGAMRSDLETHTMQYSLFTEWDASLPADFVLTAGLSANFIEYAIADRMANSDNPDHLDVSGRKVFDPVVTPRVALRRMFGPNVSVYANVSQGYSPPASADAVIPFTGEANGALEPERATQYEIGSKGNLLGNRLSYQVALFDLDVSNKLTSQAVFDTDGTVLYSYTVNGGDQVDKGLELAASYALLDNPTSFVSLVRPFVSYTYSDFTYDDFKTDNNNDENTVDYTGKNVVGVAENVINLGVDARLQSGVYANATYHRTDGVPISYDNTHRAPGYSLLNAKVGYAHEVGNRFTLDAFVGGNNLSSSRYYTQVFYNFRLDSPDPRMYLPGPYEAKYYGGVKLTFHP